MKKIKTGKNYFGLSFIATGKDTGGKYFQSKSIVPAYDSGPPEHIHSREDEGFFLEKGELMFTVDGKDVKLRAGEFLNILKGERHTWRNESGKDAFLTITFAPAGIEQMFVELDEDMSDIRRTGLMYGTEFFTGY
jgi:quercetin dioxygenase-like cupin family protein